VGGSRKEGVAALVVWVSVRNSDDKKARRIGGNDSLVT